MKNYLGRMILLVNDYENAAAFYEKNFGWERLFDESGEEGRRYLHLGLRELNVGIWLLKAEAADEKALVGRQTAGQPTMVIYTENLAGLYRRLLENDVKIKVKPVKSAAFHYLHCLDYDGNEIVVVELKAP